VALSPHRHPPQAPEQAHAQAEGLLSARPNGGPDLPEKAGHSERRPANY